MGNTTIFDDVLRTIQERRPELLIPLINEVFQTSYPLETRVNRLPEEHQKLLAKVIADSCNEVEGKTYHFECQSTRDGNMVIRMIEYDFMIALSESIRTGNKEKIYFPRSSIICLRTTNNTVSEETIEVVFSDGQRVTYQVPVLKLKDYNIEEIFEKNLLILLPYYIMNYEKELSKIASNSEKTNQLLAEYKRIIEHLEKVTKEDETGLFHDLLRMMQRVMRYLLRKEQKLRERMEDVMGGKVLPLPSDKLREERKAGEKFGYDKGINQGINQEKWETVLRMLKRKMPLVEICAIAGCDEKFVAEVRDQINENE